MILVGVDGSRAGLEAVSWAVREAGVRGTGLRIVHVMPAWPLEMSEDAPHADVGRWMRDGAASMLAEAVKRVREEDGRVPVESRLLPGDPRLVLIEATADAELLVVGSHGLGGFRGMLLGSVPLGVAGRTTCPVAVIRHPPAPPYGEVVVGVDGSPAGAHALGFAFAEASLRGAGLRAVHAWHPPVIGGWGPSALAVAEEAAEGERRLLAEALAGWGERYPDVKVTEQVECGHPVDVLKNASAQADLLVVGSRGRGDLTGLLLGSVSHSLLHQAACPLVVSPVR
ncbi:nucleotide-binding universal stress UspA family protein [Streptosporangium album]|uniref:Nucleotide-binding universal stress UspA family protein n=1 Tax=Streptosporangium album TaxID=47479 RepID=A0A7W7S4A5_9ACTN|nr:universal stress protein [Streptosporangium album]MBB4942983.1 nucleotide-binding universal stress UspA family protein [Streptosporangium album]